jgi:hypothetical protein
VQINSYGTPNPYLYKLLQPVLAEPPASEIKDIVSISHETIARKVPTALDSLIHFPERLNAALSVAGTVISWLAGPMGYVLGGLGVLAIPAGVLAHHHGQAKQDSE